MNLKSIYIYILTSLCVLFSTDCKGQNINDLNQKITLEASNITISELLEEIGNKASIKFSYNPNVIGANRRVSVSGKRKTVRAILDELFDNKFAYKLRGNYVIIAEKQVEEQETRVKSKLIIGSVVDDETLEPLPNVSIYTSAGENIISDAAGGFKIKLDQSDNSMIELRKKDYHPLSFNTRHNNSDDLQINLKAIKSLSVALERDSLVQVGLPTTNPELKTMFKLNSSLKLNLENIQDTLYKPVSLSLYPGISTYGNLSGNIIFNFAMNFVGYNRGINGAELGVLSNINKDFVKGAQLAGLSNYTGGKVTGFQAAGIFNMINGDLTGVQMGGITNLVRGNGSGSQFAGINNHVTQNYRGLQMAGIYNQADTLVGAQFASVLNIASNFSGVQVSGIGNYSKRSKGLQLAAVYNQADTLTGVQISGLVNSAKVVRGHQIGIINVADSITGIPFGIINIVKNGYRRIEFSSDELFPWNISLKTGVHRFYTILTAGAQTDVFDQNDESSFYTFGFGLGATVKLTERVDLDFNAINRHITKRDFTDDISYNLQGSIGLEVRPFKNLSIFGSAVYNFYYFDRALLEDPDFDGLRDNYHIDTSVENDNNLVWRSWMGYRFGLRLII